MGLDQFPGAAQIAIFQSVFRSVHVGRVKSLLGVLALAALGIACGCNAYRGDGRADRHYEQQQQSRCERAGQRRFAPTPTPDPFDRRDRPRLDRFAAEETAELIRQFLGALVAARRFLVQALEANRFEVGRHA